MEWVVRGGVATTDRLRKGYGAHIAVPGLFGFSVQYAPGQSWGDIAKARRFPHGQISIALDGDLQSALLQLGYTMQIVASPGRAYHHTFVVLYDASGTVLHALPQDAALALERTFRQVPNPYQGTR